MISFSSPFSGNGRNGKSLNKRLKSLYRYKAKNQPVPENTDAVIPDGKTQITAPAQGVGNPQLEQSPNVQAPQVQQGNMQGAAPTATQIPNQQGQPGSEGNVSQAPQQPKKKEEPKYSPMEVNIEEVSGAQSGWTMLHDMKDIFDNDMNLAVATYALDQFEQDPKEAGKHIGIMLALSPHWDKKYSGEGVDQARVLDLIKQQGGKESAELINEIRKAYASYEPSKFTLATVKGKH